MWNGCFNRKDIYRDDEGRAVSCDNDLEVHRYSLVTSVRKLQRNVLEREMLSEGIDNFVDNEINDEK